MTKNSRYTYLIGGALAVALSAGLWAQTSGSKQEPEHPGRAWEHLALEHAGAGLTGSPDLAGKINKLGDEGWELVDVESITRDGSTQKTVFFFKRRK